MAHPTRDCGHQSHRAAMLAIITCMFAANVAHAQIAVRGETVYTMAGSPIKDGVVVVQGGKIIAVGPAATTPIPPGMKVLTARVVTPGLIDAHSTVGLSGILNIKHDQDQLELDVEDTARATT